MTQQDMLRAALYIRVSTEDQTEYSPDAQRKLLIEYAKRNNLEVLPDSVFVDSSSGRRADTRPAFMRMIGLAKSKPKPFDVILVHKFDRFARSREDSIVFKSMLKKQCKIRVVSITESLDEEDKMSGLIEAILEAMAEYYSINLAEEVKKGMTEKALRGEPQTAPPIGYKMSSDKVYEISEAEADSIHFIFEQFVGGIELNVLARKLNDMGIKSRNGNNMSRYSLRYILQNPVYIGKVRWNPVGGRIQRGENRETTIVADAKHTPIISAELFQEAAHRLAEMKRIAKPSARPSSEYSHWLSGLLRCSACGSTLTHKGSKVSPGFQCRAYNDGRCNVSHHISVRKLEKAILFELSDALSNSTVTDFKLKVKRKESSYVDELTILQNKHGNIDNRLKRVDAAYFDAVYSLEEYKGIREQLKQEQENLLNDIERLKSAQPTELTEAANTQFKEKVSGVIEILKSPDFEIQTKSKAIRSIIDKVVFDKPNKSVEVYYYDLE